MSFFEFGLIQIKTTTTKKMKDENRVQASQGRKWVVKGGNDEQRKLRRK